MEKIGGLSRGSSGHHNIELAKVWLDRPVMLTLFINDDRIV